MLLRFRNAQIPVLTASSLASAIEVVSEFVSESTSHYSRQALTFETMQRCWLVMRRADIVSIYRDLYCQLQPLFPVLRRLDG